MYTQCLSFVKEYDDKHHQIVIMGEMSDNNAQ